MTKELFLKHPVITKSLLCLATMYITIACYAQTPGETSLRAKIITHAAKLNVPAVYLRDAVITNNYKDSRTGIEYVYLQQAHKGISVYNQIITLAFKDDTLLYSSGKFIRAIEAKAGNALPVVTPQEAVLKAAAHLHLAPLIKALSLKEDNFSSIKKYIFSAAGIAKKDIVVTQYWATDSTGKLHLSWNVNIDVINTPDWWNIRVDAVDGKIVGKDNWTVYEKENASFKQSSVKADGEAFTYKQVNKLWAPTNIISASYYVIPYPSENKNITPFSLVTSPWLAAGAGNNTAAYGWQYDGTSDYTVTRGNNVYAYDDSANKNKPGRPAKALDSNSPDLVFKAVPDAAKEPSDSMNRTAAVINLFYWNNIMHDVMYQYGFDEVSGNFQANNIGRGGLGQDYVSAEAQDGSGINNANFSTPVDGNNGRMQMYLFDAVPALSVQTPAAIAGSYVAVESDFSTKNKLKDVGTVNATTVYYSRSDTLGCNTLPAGDTSVKNKIALIYRGNCSFTVKVKNAQTAGAAAVIMVNNDGDPIIMGGTDNTITIPAVMISTEDGALFTNQIRAGNKVQVTISEGVHRDGDLDNGIICHEYGHGISNRLTGGPSNTSCLTNDEQAGEGWSDYVGLMMTTDWTKAQLTDGTKARGIGTYAVGQKATGSGIRRNPYSTDLNINPVTYADMAGSTEIHDIGEIWCSALWDMTWNIIQQQGSITQNLYDASSTGGNTIALNLVLEGMRLQPCSPGFLDSRDAILMADSILYNNAYRCAIWNAFARRGMGVSAVQGAATNATDQKAAFNIPDVQLTKTSEPLMANGQFTVKLTATCGCTVPINNYVLTDTLPKGFAYVQSSGGVQKDSIIQFGVNFTTPFEQKDYTLTLNALSIGCKIDTVVYDDRDAHTTGGFQSSILKGNVSWIKSNRKYFSASNAWFAQDADTISNFALTSDAFTPTKLSTLSFRHYINSENSFDGGIVELSSNDGSSWFDAKPYFIKDGYNGYVDSATTSLLQAAAFTGNLSDTFTHSFINLSSFGGKQTGLRFRMRSDQYARVDGWFIDDIIVANGCGGMQRIGLYNNTGSMLDNFIIPTYNTTNSTSAFTLVSFYASAQGSSASLQWSTVNEDNINKYLIERSQDSINFTVLDSVTAGGSLENDYTYLDVHPRNQNYYRLKVIDKDGNISYSVIRPVIFGSSGSIVVKPNPAHSSATVYISGDATISGILITDMQGKVLQRIKVESNQSSYIVNTNAMAPGIYLIKILRGSSSNKTIKLLVTH